MASDLCKATKKDGDPCQYKAREGCRTCWRHRTQENKISNRDQGPVDAKEDPTKE